MIATPGMETQTAKPSARKFNVLLVLVGAGTVAFLLVLLLSVILGKTEAYSRRKRLRSFCCPEEAAMVLGVVNSSVDPCEDFYAHVCSRVDSGDANHYALLTRAVISSALLDYVQWGAENTPAGRLGAYLVKGAWQKSTSPAEELVHYATAILNVTALNGSAAIDIKKTIRLLVRLSLRYGLPAALAFSVSTSSEALKIERNDGCFVNHVNESIFLPTLMAVNNALNTSVTMTDVLMLEQALPVRRHVSHTESTVEEMTSSPFQELSDFEWRAVMNELVFPVYPNITRVVKMKEDKIGDVMKFLANIAHQPVFIVYTTICAAIRLRDRVRELSERHPPLVTTTACEELDVCELVDQHQASMVSSPAMDDYVRELFAQIRRNVAEQAAKHPLLDGVSHQSLALELGRLKLMLPEQIVVSDIAVPDISETFPASYLAARSYIFDVRSAKVARQIPSSDSLIFPSTVIRGDVIYVPTSLYRFLHHTRGKQEEGLNLPLLGVDLALSLWSYLLQKRWPNETSYNMQSRLKCVRNTYLNDFAPLDFQRTVSAALGLASVFDSMASSEWRSLYPVNSTEWSLGQLMYLLWAYDQCRSLSTLTPRLDVNFALKNSPAFSEAFGCSKSSPMAQSIGCFDKHWTNV